MGSISNFVYDQLREKPQKGIARSGTDKPEVAKEYILNYLEITIYTMFHMERGSIINQGGYSYVLCSLHVLYIFSRILKLYRISRSI